jgi:hypothetical protein
VDDVPSEQRLAQGLMVLGAVTLIGLIPVTWFDWAAAFVPLAGAVVVLYLKPVGNRMMATGLAILSALLFVALWRFEVFFAMLVILVAVILAGAGVLKSRGKW